jgi:hypothetical protein
VFTGVELNLYHTICAPRQLTGGFASLVTPNLHKLPTGRKHAFRVRVRNVIQGGLGKENVLRLDQGIGTPG